MTSPFEPVDTAAWLAWARHAPDMPMPRVPAIRIECTNEPTWLDQRRHGLGASEIGAVMGVSTWASPYALWWRKKLDWRLPRTETQRWGHLVEDPIATLFAEDHPEMFVASPVGAPWSLWAHPVRRWMLCTPDRLAVDRDGVVVPVELKSDEGGPGWGEPGTDEVPEHHRMQSMWQAYIFGAPGGWVVRRRGSGKGRTAAYWIPCDANVVAGMVDAGGDFLESIEEGREPELDGSASTTYTLKQVNPALDENSFAEVPWAVYYEWRWARRSKRDAVARDALASNRMRAVMGRAEFATVRKVNDGDPATVVFAKRRIGKRTGYEVAPGMIDELREVGSGELEETGHLFTPGGVVSAAAAAVVEKGAGPGDSSRTGVGDGEGDGAGAADVVGDALSGGVDGRTS